MKLKTFGAAAVSAGFVAFPLVACGSGAPTTTAAPTVTATATAPSSTSSSSCTITNGYENWEACWRAEQRQHPTATATSPASAAPAHPKSSGIPWWAWALIVPAGLAVLLVLGIKLMEANDERTVARAWQKVDALDARHRARFGDDDGVEDYPEDDDELDDEDMDFLHRVTDPAPAAPAAPPASGGNLLSSLRQQGGGAQ
ncbi:hypothetical protein [Mycobacteroides abscessus]|uniref:hypothetical protein n=1 Tax=Mycobacteroides abscessus TaxID=36809 RepID=UPI0021047B29|nr:hypothetical protein [Mycobacteroides abscessus]